MVIEKNREGNIREAIVNGVRLGGIGALSFLDGPAQVIGGAIFVESILEPPAELIFDAFKERFVKPTVSVLSNQLNTFEANTLQPNTLANPGQINHLSR